MTFRQRRTPYRREMVACAPSTVVLDTVCHHIGFGGDWARSGVAF